MTTLNIPAASPTPSRPHDAQTEDLRHDLVDAQVQVLSIYLDKRPPEHLVTALDRLIACCRASFREEEELMARLGGQIDPAHRERHQTVMHQLSELRFGALVTDRGRLLASLILIDRELIAHIAEAALVSAEA